ncbi:MAG: hypothetical protein WBF33_38010 [Candidatus Nitrosopolaris sp.]
MFRTSLKSTTAIVFSTLTIAAAALLFALGPTLGNQQALALVYGHHVVVVHHPSGHHVVVVHHY